MTPIVILPSGPRSKYRAVPVVIDGVRFDSQGEATRFGELQALERTGAISQLRRQVVLKLHVFNGFEIVPIGRYRADFAYLEPDPQQPHVRRVQVFEDFKGFDTPLGRWKRKHAALEWGATVRLSRAR